MTSSPSVSTPSIREPARDLAGQWDTMLADVVKDGDEVIRDAAWRRHFVGWVDHKDTGLPTGGAASRDRPEAALGLWNLARAQLWPARPDQWPYLQHRADALDGFDPLISRRRVNAWYLGVQPADDLTDGSSPDYGPLRHLLRGHIRVLQAVMDLTREEMGSFDRFRRHLLEAAWHYDCWWRGAEWGKPLPNLASAGSAYPWPGEVASGGWRDHHLADLPFTLYDIREALEGASANSSPHDEGLLVSLAMVERGIRWLLGCDDAPADEQAEQTHTRRVTVVFAVGDSAGAFGQLVVTRRLVEPRAVAGDGDTSAARRKPWLDPQETVFFPDPVTLGVTAVSPDWLRAFGRATRYAERPSGGDDQKISLGRVSWRLEFPDWNQWKPPQGLTRRWDPWLGGPSASGAAACALVALRDGLPLDAGVCLTAEARDDGTLGPVSGCVAKLFGLGDKQVNNPQQDALLDAVAPFVQYLLTVEPSPWLIQAGQLRDIEVHDIVTVPDALDRMTRRLEAVLEFLDRLAVTGFAQALLFKPPGWDSHNLFEFAIPPRVVTQHEWKEFYRARSDRRDDSAMTGYVVSATEEELRATSRENGASPGATVRLKSRPLVTYLGYDSGLLMLWGEPGEGKTTALWWGIAWCCRTLRADLSRGRYGLDSKSCRLPLVVALGSVGSPQRGASQPGLFEVGLKRVTELAMPGEAVVNWMAQKAKRHEVRLFVDALDELVARDTIEIQRSGMPEDVEGSRRSWLGNEIARLSNDKIPIFLTSRYTANIAGFAIGHAAELRLVCFGNREQRSFVKQYFSKHPDAVRHSAAIFAAVRQTPGPRALARLPLLLAILCRVRETLGEGGVLPETKTEVLQAGLIGLMRQWHRKRVGDQEPPWHEWTALEKLKVRVLRYLAWTYYDIQPLPFTRDGFHGVVARLPVDLQAAVKKVYAQFSEPPDALFDQLHKVDGIIVTNGAAYGFLLRSFHELSLAGWVGCESPPVMSGNYAAFEKIIRARAGKDAEGNDPWQRSDWGTIQAVGSNVAFKPLNHPGWANVWPLVVGHTDGMGTHSLLAGLWREREESEDVVYSRLRLVVSTASDVPASLQKSSTFIEDAICELGCLLENAGIGAEVQASCAGALGALRTPRACDVLMRALTNNASSLVRARYAAALGSLGDPRAQDVLVRIKNNPEESTDLRRACDFALRILGSSSISNEFNLQQNDVLDIPQHELFAEVWRNEHMHDSLCQLCADANALIAYGDPRAHDIVARIMEHDKADVWLRLECACVLSELGEPRACDVLIRLLEDRSTSQPDLFTTRKM